MPQPPLAPASRNSYGNAIPRCIYLLLIREYTIYSNMHIGSSIARERALREVLSLIIQVRVGLSNPDIPAEIFQPRYSSRDIPTEIFQSRYIPTEIFQW